MNRKVLLSLLVIGVAALMVGLGTAALFTDSATSEDNTFTAGTLDIEAGTTWWAGSVDNIKPGDTMVFTVPITNAGSLPLNYTVSAEVSGDLAEGDNPVVVTSIVPDAGSLDVLGGADIVVTLTMPLDAGNEYQGKSGTLDVTIDAVQQ